MKKLLLILFIYIGISSASAGVWYGENDAGERVPFGRKTEHYGSSSNSIDKSDVYINKPKTDDIYLIFGLVGGICLLYFFCGEGSFKNRREDVVIRYITLLGGIGAFYILTMGWMSNKQIQKEWASKHSKEAAFNNIVDDEDSVKKIRARAKSELNIDFDSLLTARGLDSKSGGSSITNTINFSPVNIQTQSQTMYRGCSHQQVDTIYYDVEEEQSKCNRSSCRK